MAGNQGSESERGGTVRIKRARVLLGAVATAVALTTIPSSASTGSTQMTCSEPLEAVCVAIGIACRTLDTIESKVTDKDLINCQLG